MLQGGGGVRPADRPTVLLSIYSPENIFTKGNVKAAKIIEKKIPLKFALKWSTPLRYETVLKTMFPKLTFLEYSIDKKKSNDD